jgi:hypothetical protein
VYAALGAAAITATTPDDGAAADLVAIERNDGARRDVAPNRLARRDA